MDDEQRRAAIQHFYDIYNPLRRKYGLRLCSKTAYDDAGTIKIYRYDGEDEKGCICSLTEPSDVLLYERAAKRLTAWKEKMEDRNGRSNAPDHTR